MRLSAGEDSKQSSQILHLTVPSGHRPSETALRFVESGGHLQILAPADPLPRWAVALSATGTALWRIGRNAFSGHAIPMTGPDAREVLAKFEAEFGAHQVRHWFGAHVQPFELQPVDSKGLTYRESVEAYFDSLASSYDARVDGNPLDQELRRASVGVLLRVFRPGDRVLELGCGTGLETLALASRGIRVVATDVSGSMIRQLQGKIDAELAGRFVEARQMAASDVGSLVDQYGRNSFDGVFSTFGALNCEENFETIPSALAKLVQPCGGAVFGIWNRFCAAEVVLSITGRNFQRVFARQRRPVTVGMSRYGIPVYALSVSSFVKPFHPYFQVERVLGLPVFVPPYDYDRVFAHVPGLVRALRGLDRRVADRFPFNRIGDHFVVEMKRRQ